MNIQFFNIDDKKSRIMHATIEVVAECGIHATPMTQISKRADVATGTIYHYFENKEALIRETYLEVKQRQIRELLKHTNSTLDYQSQFMAYWHAMYQTLLTPHYLSFLEQCAISPLIDEQTLIVIETMAQPLSAHFEDGIHHGIIKPLPSRLLFHLIFASVSSVARIHLTSLLILDEDTLNQACLFCWDGLKAPNN